MGIQAPPPQSPAPEPPKTVLISTFNEGGIAVTLSFNAASPDPWATHLLRSRDGQKLRGTYMSHWDDALQNFAQRCRNEKVEPDFDRLSELTIAETAVALTDSLHGDASQWDQVYGYLKDLENGFPSLWTIMGRMAILGEAEFGHLWSEGKVEYIDVLDPTVKNLALTCERLQAEGKQITDEDLLRCWRYGLEDAGQQMAAVREKKRRWPDWSAIADSIHNHEAYRPAPRFFGLRRFAKLGNRSDQVHYLDADGIRRLMVHTTARFTEEGDTKWQQRILEVDDEGYAGEFRFIDGPEYWNEDSEVVDDLPC